MSTPPKSVKVAVPSAFASVWLGLVGLSAEAIMPRTGPIRAEWEMVRDTPTAAAGPRFGKVWTVRRDLSADGVDYRFAEGGLCGTAVVARQIHGCVDGNRLACP